jgi:hypothetical protein
MSPRPLTQIKHFTDGLVVRWVTTSESPLLYVFDIFLVPVCTVLGRQVKGLDMVSSPLRTLNFEF